MEVAEPVKMSPARLVVTRVRSPFGSLAPALRWVLPPLVIMVLSWAPLLLRPQALGDQSWQAALQMAVHQDLSFGVRIIWTYGPLGFLSWPTFWETHLGAIAVLYTVVIRFAVAAAVFHSLRRSLGGFAAFVGALILVSIAAGSTGETALVMILGAWALDTGLDGRRATVAVAASGAFAAIESLNKVSVGGSLILMTAVLVIALPGRRRERFAAAAIGFLVTLLAFWLVLSEPLSAMPQYAMSSVEVVSGYAATMSSEEPGLGWEPYAVLFGLVFGVWSAVRMTDGGSLRKRGGLVALWCLFIFASFKEGFVRHDAVHASWFFSALILGVTGFRWSRRDRSVALVAIISLALMALANQGQTGTRNGLNLPANTSAFFTDGGDTLIPGKEKKLQRQGRAEVRERLPLSAATLHLLRGHTVAEWPSYQEQPWAYELDWDPLPVILAYSGYTTKLDSDDANYLNSAAGPQRIVFAGTPGIDGRIGSFDQSTTLRSMLCRYRPVRFNPGNLILARGPSRCTQPARLVKTVHAQWGKKVSVPALPTRGHWMVFVRISGTEVTGLEKIVSALYKPPPRYVQVNREPAARLVTGTAADGLVLRVSKGLDYPFPYNIAVGAHSIDALLVPQQTRAAGPQLTYTFYVQRISGPRIAAPKTKRPKAHS